MARPSIMIAFGLPGPHGEEEPHEDNREHDGEGDDDIATEAIVSIVHNLHRGGPSAVRDLRKFTAALEGMCETFMSRDRKGFEDAASEARDALEGLIGE